MSSRAEVEIFCPQCRRFLARWDLSEPRGIYFGLRAVHRRRMPSGGHHRVELMAMADRVLVRFRCDCGYQRERRLDRLVTLLRGAPSRVLFV
jgi:ribosomal protein L44E